MTLENKLRLMIIADDLEIKAKTETTPIRAIRYNINIKPYANK